MSDELEPNQEIVLRFLKGIRSKMSLTERSCYPSVAPAYIEGQEPTVVQVIPGDANPEEPGEGFQDGGALFTTLRITCVIWRRMKRDQHGHSQEMLMAEADGMMVLGEQLKTIFKQTRLGNILCQRVRWAGETAVTWYDIDKGVVRKDIMFLCSYAEELPRMCTLTSEDLE